MSAVILRQRALLEGWLQSADAVRVARRFVHNRSMRRAPEELLSEAWLRVDRRLHESAAPLPEMADEVAAARYMFRVLDNVSRDMLRADGRRHEVELADQLVTSPASDGVDGRVLIEQLIWAVGREAEEPRRCDGCTSAVVASAALTLLHLLLADHDGAVHGRSTLDRLLYEALQRTAHAGPLSDSALRQRKARCGDCIVALISDGLRRIGMVAA